MRTFWNQLWRRGLLALLAALALCAGMAAPASAKPLAPDVVVTLRPDPGIFVTRGGILTYEVRAEKQSRGTAYSINIIVPYDPEQLTLLGASFTDDRDWVTSRKPGKVEIFMRSTGPTRVRIARLSFRVNTQLPDYTAIGMRASYEWDGGGMTRSNWTPVLVGGSDLHDPHVWVGAQPGSAARGARVRFLSDRFLPGEEIALWLNTPDGVRAINTRLEADLEGVVRYDYITSGLRPGAYSLVFAGISSDLIGVGAFVVE